MEFLFNLFLVLHIAGGTAGLITGGINLVRKKGDTIHKRTGRIFICGMLTAGGSAVVLSALHPNTFLMIVGLFAMYMVGTGYRYIHLRLAGIDNGPKALDWALTRGMTLAVVLFLGLGIMELTKGNVFGIVYLVFGSIGLFFVKKDLHHYKGKARQKNYWLLAHLQRMTGGYIAALTAFLVVNADHFPSIIPTIVYWLLPTAILTPLIIRWSRNYLSE